MERIVPAHVDSPFEFEFAAPLKTPRPLVTVESAACGYAGTQIVGGINVSIGPMDRIALLGPNGAGKSTLTKIAGRRSGAAVGKAHGGGGSRGRLLRAAAAGAAAGRLRRVLAPAQPRRRGLRRAARSRRCAIIWDRFGFQGDRAFDPVGRFSGGEKARLTLALLVARRPNLLLLDEPTNHLDIDMRQALTVALQGFEGGLVVVSHDRHLIKTVADTLWLVADGRLQAFDGDLDDYQQWLRSRGKARPGDPEMQAASKTGGQSGSQGGGRGAAGTARPAARRDPKSRLQQRLDKVEASIAAVAAERVAARRRARGKSAARQAQASGCANLERDAAFLEAQWMEIGTAIEAAEIVASGHRLRQRLAPVPLTISASACPAARL